MRYLTAGESHGPQLTMIIEGIPSHLPFSVDKINKQLARRQKGYGRGRRMQIEKDKVNVVGGVRHGETTGAPVALEVINKDWKNWEKIMGPEPVEEENAKRRVSRPRPGHADLNGGMKYRHRDLRNILERSSARETTARVSCGAVGRLLLEEFGMQVGGHVVEIGGIRSEKAFDSLDELVRVTEESPVRCIDSSAEAKMIEKIDEAKKEGDTLGGVVEVIIENVPVGLGSHVQWDRKLDARIARAMTSIQAFKGVEIGVGFEAASRPGSEVHDEIAWNQERGYYRSSNRAGGFEGGMTTGMPIVVRGVMKPIPTLYKPLQSVDIDSKESFSASIERSDNCAVPAASVVAENVVAWEVACAFMEKFGGDAVEEMHDNLANYRDHVERF